MDAKNATLLVKAIIKGQKEIIGPLAIEQANGVAGLHVSSDLTAVKVERDGADILKDLVSRYEQLFGLTSVEACKESIRQVLGKVDASQVPSFLK